MCPTCGKPMRKMIARKGRNAGNAVAPDVRFGIRARQKRRAETRALRTRVLSR